MVTYLAGTDAVETSEVICEYLDRRVGDADHIEVVSVYTGDDVDEIKAREDALETFEERFGDRVSVTVHQFNRDRSPSDELVELAEEIDADEIVVGLRRHSRTERVIFGSVSHSMIERATRPITLVPLPEYQAPEE